MKIITMKLIQVIKKFFRRVLGKVRRLPAEWQFKIYEKKFNGKPYTPFLQQEIQLAIKNRRDIYFHNEKTAKDIADSWKGEVSKPKSLRFIENAIPVVMSANEDFAPYMAVMLQSLLDNSNPQRKYHFIVFERNFSDKTKNILIDQVSSFFYCAIDFVCTENAFNEIPIATSKGFHFSVDTFSRLFIPYWLDKYPKVIYCDGDMLAKADIAELYDVDILDKCMAATVTPSFAKDIEKQQYNTFYASSPVYLLIENWSRYINAGLLVFDTKNFLKKLSYQDMFKFAIYYTNRYKKHMNDQDVLSVLIKEDYFILPPEWNCLWHHEFENGQRWQVVPNVKIIHFSSDVKPWKTIAEIENNQLVVAYRNYANKVPLYTSLCKR